MTYRSQLSNFSFSIKSYSAATFSSQVPICHDNSPRELVSHITHNVSKGCLKVLRALLELKQRHKHLYPSHARIASMAQVSVATVKRAIEKLQELHLLVKQTMVWDTCQYFINEQLLSDAFLRVFKTFCINFRWALFSASLLMSKVVAKPDELLLIINVKKDLINLELERVSLTPARARDDQKGVKVEDFKEPYWKTSTKPLVSTPKKSPIINASTQDFRQERINRAKQQGWYVEGMLFSDVLNYERNKYLAGLMKEKKT